jgi:predicted nucleic acid-binding protein
VKTIIDAGPLVALLNRRDSFHDWVTQALKALALPLFVCEPVLTEAAYLTGKPAALLAMLGDGSMKIGLGLEEQGDAVRRLLDRYGARMSLADACVVRMSELARQSRVFTLDRSDFSIYRRNGRDVIPLIAP